MVTTYKHTLRYVKQEVLFNKVGLIKLEGETMIGIMS